MPVYRYEHKWCGFSQDVMLENVDKSSVVMPCYRCGRAVSARQVMDKSAKVGKADDGTIGILRHEPKNKARRRGQN